MTQRLKLTQPTTSPALTSEQKLELVLAALEDLKGRDINCIDVRPLTQITDYMVIATGTSNTHIKALSDTLITRCKSAGLNLVGVEGRQYAEWVLVDAEDIIVHIMTAPTRELYNLEELWNFNNSR